MQKNRYAIPARPYVLLPLRLFLGITFVYAGIQKILDPQFFSSSASGYIGRQISRFAIGSPIHDLLVNVAAPHAKLFGIIIIFGEIAIGLGTLSGFLFRPAAFFGTLLSLLFFLSASWHVYPYFYGADIVFAVGWLTLTLNGPLFTGLPTLDELLSLRLLQTTPLRSQSQVVSLLAIVIGTTSLRATPQSIQPSQPSRFPERSIQQPTTSFSPQQQVYQRSIAQPKTSRRTFLWGSLTGGAVTLGIFAVGYAMRVLSGNAVDVATSGSNTSSGPPTPVGTTTTTGSVSASGQITQVSAVPVNSAVTFTLPSTGDPGVLVHLENGQFVAYDALCTHAGCQVDYDPSSQLLECPCHGAAFDPAKGAEVVNPPASTPLGPVKITVDSATGAIKLA